MTNVSEIFFHKIQVCALNDNLKAVGAPYKSEMICVTREHLIQTFDYIPYMRSRFTNVDAISRLGLLPQLKEYLFEEIF